MNLNHRIILLLAILFTSCAKQKIEINLDSISTYFPIEKNRSITYQLDSTIYSEFNNTSIIKSYIVRDVLDTSITDNLGKINYLYKRSIRNKIDTTKWDLSLLYRVIKDSNRIQVVENNLRFTKLIAPLREGLTWKGNSFINTNENTGLDYLDDWSYTYGKPNLPESVNNINFPQTISVIQINDTVGNLADRKQYSAILYAKEIYAKGVGLVFKEIKKEAWQPPNSNNPNGYYEKNSFGIKLKVLSISK